MNFCLDSASGKESVHRVCQNALYIIHQAKDDLTNGG